jgi:hypothetical protein
MSMLIKSLKVIDLTKIEKESNFPAKDCVQLSYFNKEGYLINIELDKDSLIVTIKDSEKES